MVLKSPPEASLYRVTLFFGPEEVEEASNVLACVFNVKKRSWKAGIQVAVEIGIDQLTILRHTLDLDDRLAKSLMALAPDDLPHYQQRITDLFAQTLCWCKLDLRLLKGLTPENQRIQAHELTHELHQSARTRSEFVVTYIVEELGLAGGHS